MDLDKFLEDTGRTMRKIEGVARAIHDDPASSANDKYRAEAILESVRRWRELAASVGKAS